MHSKWYQLILSVVQNPIPTRLVCVLLVAEWLLEVLTRQLLRRLSCLHRRTLIPNQRLEKSADLFHAAFVLLAPISLVLLPLVGLPCLVKASVCRAGLL